MSSCREEFWKLVNFWLCLPRPQDDSNEMWKEEDWYLLRSWNCSFAICNTRRTIHDYGRRPIKIGYLSDSDDLNTRVSRTLLYKWHVTPSNFKALRIPVKCFTCHQYSKEFVRYWSKSIGNHHVQIVRKFRGICNTRLKENVSSWNIESVIFNFYKQIGHHNNQG